MANVSKIRAERSRDGEYVEISVEDQGPGIPEQYQKKIFDRFFRVENATHTVKGTGLGLHLVKVTIEKHHHGQVFVQSKEGEGSTFGFRLPIKPARRMWKNIFQRICFRLKASLKIILI